eukprot:TRINITY_DN1863_c0_g1_i13.p2 TRINITY_DN1863_c0_g1~~TRINITY_DN1863_c0_g1_i13.p2  ORF type:complete len:101 (-),score=4.52 TRINITY_DN1863_c0_g1_i13:225-527(-)
MKEQRKSDDRNCIAEEQDIDYAKPWYVFCLTLFLLFIENNNIEYEGTKDIGIALQKNKTLTTLNLGMSFVQHYCYSSQRIMILDMKEQKKSNLHCRRIRH